MIMSRKETPVPVAGSLLLVTVILNAIVLQSAYTSGNSSLYWLLLISLPLLFFALYITRQPKIKQAPKKMVARRGYCWFRMLQTRPRHYFTGMLPQEQLLKSSSKPAIYRTQKKKMVKTVMRKPL
jgi:hypothetical protein